MGRTSSHSARGGSCRRPGLQGQGMSRGKGGKRARRQGKSRGKAQHQAISFVWAHLQLVGLVAPEFGRGAGGREGRRASEGSILKGVVLGPRAGRE